MTPRTTLLLLPALFAAAASAQTFDIEPVRRPEWRPLAPLDGAAPVVLDIESNLMAPAEVFAATTAGLVHSADRGETWTLRSRWSNEVVQLADLAVAATDPSRVAVARPLSGLETSTDGGATWTSPAAAPSGSVWSVAFDPVVPTRLFAGTSTGLWASDDGGVSFAPMIDTTSTGDRCRRIEIDRNNRLRVYAVLEPGRLVGSEDGGVTWTPRTLPAGPGFYFGFDVDPHDGRRVAMCASGVHLSHDGGATWIDASPPTTAYIDAVAFDAVRGGHLFATARGEGTWVTADMGATWTLLDPLGLARAGGAVTDYFSSAAYPGDVIFGASGGFFRSTDGGSTFARSNDGLAPYAFVRSVATDPSNPLHVVAQSGGSTFVSTDGGSSWTESAPVRGFDAFEVVADASTPGRFYAGQVASEEGRFWRSDDGGLSFVDVSTTPGAYFFHVESHPTLPGVVFGAGSGLRRSDDAGATWTNTGLPSSWVWDVAVSPADPSVIYASTTSSVHASADGGATWTAATTPPVGIVRDLEASPVNADVVVASVPFGGLWRSTDRGASWSRVTGSPATCHFARFVAGVPGGLLVAAWLETGVMFNGRGAGAFPAYGSSIETSVNSIHVEGTEVYAATEGAGVYVLR